MACLGPGDGFAGHHDRRAAPAPGTAHSLARCGRGVALLLIAGVAQPLLTRLTGTSTISLRGAIWDATLDQWLAHPLVGSGPGSFSSTFTLSGFFNTYADVNRHADNAVVQLLAEAGLVGIASLSALLAALVVGVRNARFRWAPVTGLAIFAFASFTDNPSDSAHLVVIAIAWMAIATPRTASPEPRSIGRRLRGWCAGRRGRHRYGHDRDARSLLVV